MKYTVFYSWQSDTESKYNWALIRDCINSAIKNIENKGQLKGIYFYDLQESTSNIPGTPDIVPTIEERIDNCDIFIGDLTVCNNYKSLTDFLKNNPEINYKFSPNSNVFGEYNRAFGNHSSTAIIAVMNDFYGDPKENDKFLPFDIRQKRFPFLYSCGQDEEIKEGSSNLITFFENSIRESILGIIEEERYRYIPFVTFAEHRREFSPKCEYCSNETLEMLKRSILYDSNNVRILGISGVGKTRLVIEAVKDSEDFISRYLYCDCFNDDFEDIKRKVELILRHKENPLIVLDNCSYEQAQNIIRFKKRYSATNCKIVTIWNQEDKNTLDGFVYIDLNVDLQDVVAEIIVKKSVNISEENKKLINEFSDGIPLMAILLVESLNEGNSDIGKLSNNDFVNKLIFEEKEEREILKSCSLFRYIGYDGDYRRQIKFIIENTAITPISGDTNVKIALFDKLFNKYKKRDIIETNGRLFGIRPRPLAFALAEEWFDDCSDERMGQVIQLIQGETNPDSKILTESLCTQIRYLGDSQKVKSLIEKLLGQNGPFYNAEVVNTELGSRLFRSFVEVNPMAVADNLYRLFGSMTIDQLKKVEESRRNLVWTLEKLCFDKNTFEKGAKLMMSFAIAENETWGNNSTGEFLHLFKIHLAGTQANYDERLKIINWGSTKDDYTELSIKAIDSSLEAYHFSYMSGAEFQGTKKLEQYTPETWDEIFKYWNTSLEILMSIIRINPEYSKNAYDVLVNRVRGLCSVNACQIILPKIKKTIILKGYDWDGMLDSLYDVKNIDFDKITPEYQAEILEMIKSLTKDDFVSRFMEVKKNRNQDFENYSFEEDIKYRQEQYIELAVEFFEKELYSVENLKKIFLDKESFSIPFGFTLAELINENVERRNLLIRNCVEAILGFNEFDFNPSIILDFIRGSNEEGIKLFIDSLRIYDNLKYLLFPIFAVRKSSFDSLDELFTLIEEQKVSLSHFRDFFNYYPELTSVSEEKIINVFSRILNFEDEGFELIMTLSHNMLYFKNKTSEFNQLKDFVEGVITAFPLSEAQKKGRDLYFQNIVILLKDKNRSILAKYINSEIIKLAKDVSISFGLNYDVEKIYKILIEYYFDDIWVDLSNALLSVNEDYFIYYHLKTLLGSHIGGVGREIGLLFLGNTDIIFTWCSENPEKAPERLAGMVPIFDGETFHPYAKRLIDEFGDNQEVLSSLSSTMGTFSWTSSVIPLYLKKRKLFESILNHPKLEVREWAVKYIGYIDADIKREEQSEEERRFLYS